MTQEKTIGINIKNYRTKLGLNQEDLANYLGISREEVSYYENNKRTIPTDIINKTAKLFGVNEYDLYEESPDKIDINVAFAFRANALDDKDLHQISDFRKIVLNYLNMHNVIYNESSDIRKKGN